MVTTEKLMTALLCRRGDDTTQEYYSVRAQRVFQALMISLYLMSKEFYCSALLNLVFILVL